MTDTFWSGYGNALSAIGNVGGQIANRRAGARLGAGDYKGAAGALFDNGNLQGGAAVQAAGREQQQAETARQAQATLRITGALRAVRDRGGNVVEALDSFRPQIAQMGVDDSQFTQIRTILERDPRFIDELERLAGASAEEYDFRDGGAGDVVRVNKRTGQAERAYDAPDRPIATQFGIILPPGAGGSVAPMPGGGQPLTGGAISSAPLYNPSAMEGITAQSESGSRERDAQGRLITSPAGAQGMMQVMPGTNTDPGYGVAPARDNSDAERTRVGREYLSAMMREYGGDPAKAWGAYNWGPGNLDRAIQRYGEDWLNYAPAETQNYVANNLRQLNSSGNPQPEEQGDAGLPQDGTQDLGGGYRLQPMETAADRRSAAQQATQVARWAREDARNARTDERAARNDERQADGQTFSQENQLRSQFGQNKAVKDMGAVAAQVSIIGNIARRAAAGEDISAADDLALIFSYMKMLDPESAVREGEFANAQNTGGVGDRIVNLYNNIRNGNRLNDRQRAEFFQSATGVMNGYREAYDAQSARTRGLAESYGLDPNRVVPRRGEPGSQRQEGLVTAPGLRFQITPGQMALRQRIISSGGNPRARVGDRQNPSYINPSDPNGSFANVPRGGYFVTPDGSLRGPKP